MKNPWLSPIEGIGAAEALTDALRGAPGIASAFIFGSVASGTARADSDLDLMVIGPIEGRRLSGLTRELPDATLGRVLNYVLYTEAEWKQRIESRNAFALRVLEEPKLFVVGTEKTLTELAPRSGLRDGGAR